MRRGGNERRGGNGKIFEMDIRNGKKNIPGYMAREELRKDKL